MLGLSTGRISHMLDAGVLQAVPFGNERLVTLASINERKANPRKAGRPKKEKGGKLMEKKEYRIRDANAHRDKNAPKRIADDIELQVWIEERDWQGKVLCFAIPNQHGEFSSREDVELTTRRVAAHYDVPVECVTEI